MADNLKPSDNNVDIAETPNEAPIAFKNVAGVLHQRVVVQHGGAGSATDVSAASPLPVSGPLTDAELRATAVPVSVASLPLPSGAATQATLAAVLAALADILTELGQKLEPGGAVSVSNFPATQSVSGTVAVSNHPAQQTDALTDAQLRAAAVPVSAASLPLPSGAATQTTLANIDADLGLTSDAAAASDTATASLIALTKRLLTKTPAVGQAAMAASSPVVIASNQSAVPVSIGSTNLTPTRSIVTNAASVAAGAQVVAFKNVGTVNVTVLGVTLTPEDSRSFFVPYPFKLGAIAYVATGGSLEIVEVR